MSGIDYFALMVDVTEQYIRELGLGSPSGDGVSGCPPDRADDSKGNGAGSRMKHSAIDQAVRNPAADSKNIASPAPASEDALGWQGGGEHPINSSPLNKFDAPSSQERSGSDQPAAVHQTAGEEPRKEHLALLSGRESAGQPRGAAIHSGDTIDRLMDAVERCMK